ncbi:MAG: arginine--tRNA ligase [Treponema sp.]
MADIKEQFRKVAAAALNEFMRTKGADITVEAETLAVQTPPDPDMGDFGIPLFAFAKTLRTAPPQIANAVSEIINNNTTLAGIDIASVGKFLAVGPYLNLKLNKAAASFKILERIASQKENYGSFNENGTKHLAGRKVMVEFSSPNTNKPLHLGHLRNDALGESVSRILKKAGAEVFKVDLINDRGIHICKSMLAYKLFHEKNGDTPESLCMKGDHFVGQCYIEFDKYAKEHLEALVDAEEMLVKWEAGDEETRALWKRMNGWTFEGVKETYERTGVSFDKFYFESDTYLKGKEEVLKGLEKGVFFKADDGSVRIDITEAVGKGKDGEDHEKIMLRKDGTSVYITQDIGTAISRHDDWQFNQLVFVVASEQIYHFKVLFYILKKLGFDWAERLFHLSYGLVNLPSGRMKSREGTIVDADDLIDSLHFAALNEIGAKGRTEALSDPREVAEKVALAALNYYLLQVTPIKDMLFNPEESLSFTGNTGPYIQYMGARITSILQKAKEAGIKPLQNEDAARLLTAPEEWELIKTLSDFPDTLSKAAETLDPSIIALYLYETARQFGKFYQQCPILTAEDDTLASARLFLADCTLTVMKNAMELALVPYLPEM